MSLVDLIGKDVLVVITLPPGRGRVTAASHDSHGNVWLDVEHEDGQVRAYGLGDVITL